VNPNAPKTADATSTDHTTNKANETVEHDPILALEYHRYLREIVNVLETDPAFKQMIENASADDIKVGNNRSIFSFKLIASCLPKPAFLKSGKIASHLELVNHNVRTKLDELKRKEIERLRQLITRKVALNSSEF
jgi:hypothetical protein